MKKIMMAMGCIALVLFIYNCKAQSSECNGEPGVNYCNEALNFQEIGLDSNVFSLSSLRGKIVMLNFSAYWCVPCKEETPELNQIYNTYKERGFEIVQVVYQNENFSPTTVDDLKRWQREFGTGHVLLTDPDRSTVNAYEVKAFPTNIIIDRDGIIRYRYEGFIETDIIQTIEDFI